MVTDACLAEESILLECDSSPESPELLSEATEMTELKPVDAEESSLSRGSREQADEDCVGDARPEEGAVEDDKASLVLMSSLCDSDFIDEDFSVVTSPLD